MFERRPTLVGQTRLRTATGWISERSRDGKQLVESVLSDDSDSDSDDDQADSAGAHIRNGYPCFHPPLAKLAV